ncbi:family 43 glycosylhydrolase [Globicatella sulfidifaciens]
MNPYLPFSEYVPDGEPHVFGDRVYVYGSHDRFNGFAYCLNDYVCYSADVDDLTIWEYEGVIYKKTDDPENKNGEMCLYAPDVVKGIDGRYYLYYVLDKIPVVSVAVCDEPAGKYKFLGYVHYADGERLGEKGIEDPQFDPAVIIDNNKVYLYTGFGGFNDPGRKGMMVTVLDTDMLTIIEAPRFIIPSEAYSKGTEFEEHPFFEAPSIRKIGDYFYLLYSSVVMHELCYAKSISPTKDFRFGGVIISNNDMGIDSYKPADKPMYYGGNNHGGIERIKDRYYVFYHRHTNGSNFCRQGMIEPIEILDDGFIPQVEMTSTGARITPFAAEGEYSAAIACNLFCDIEEKYSAPFDLWMNNDFPKITQDGSDSHPEESYITNMRAGATAGYKYFYFNNNKKISIKTRGYANGNILVNLSWNGEVLGRIPVSYTNVWVENEIIIDFPNGIHPLYLTYVGEGNVSILSFKF